MAAQVGRLAALGIVLLSVLAVVPQAAAVEACRTVPAAGPATFGGAWSGDEKGGKLFLLDSGGRSLARFSLDGSLRGEIRDDVRAALDYFEPRGIWPLADGGMVFSSPNFNLLQFDRRLLPVLPIRDVGSNAGVGTDGVFPYRWGLTGDGLADGGVVVCGDLRAGPEEDDAWAFGLFYLPLGGGEPVVLEAFDIRDVRRLGCRLDGQVIANVEDGQRKRTFVLLLDEPPQIFEVKPKAKEKLVPLRLKGDLLPAMADRPALPPTVQRDAYADLMKTVESSTLPVELTGFEGSLYLLMREYDNVNSEVRWRVARIDPDTGQTDVSDLDVQANHVTMVAGPKYFAFALKGPYRGLADQDLNGFRMVPADRMRDLAGRSSLCAP